MGDPAGVDLVSAAGRPTRPYDSPVRREQVAQTRRRIVEAGCELLRESSIRDWRALTIRAVAQRAGVNERTVYRHFDNERCLRDQVMRQLEHQAGIDLDGLTLDDVVDVTRRIVETVSAHPLPSRPQLDPTLTDTGRRERDALRRAVERAAPGRDPGDHGLAAAMIDVLWGVATYERIVVDWQLDEDRAVAGITWVAGLIEEAIRRGDLP